MDKIRIMLVDDHEIVRNSLALFVDSNEDFHLVGQASSGSEALTRFEQCHPKVVLMDLVMPEINGVETIHRLLAIDPSVRIIALTSFAERVLAQQALEAGAVGLVFKISSIHELADAIYAAARGETIPLPKAYQEPEKPSTKTNP